MTFWNVNMIGPSPQLKSSEQDRCFSNNSITVQTVQTAKIERHDYRYGEVGNRWINFNWDDEGRLDILIRPWNPERI